LQCPLLYSHQLVEMQLPNLKLHSCSLYILTEFSQLQL
jgi:hypothetical protein